MQIEQRGARGTRGKPFNFPPCSPCSPWLIFLCLCVSVVHLYFLCGCGKRSLQGSTDLPPGILPAEGVFEDVGPRWSHSGAQIAFLRHTADRKYQICIASADLNRVTALLTPEIINPDRPLRTGKAGYRAPECLAWSADDRYIAFPRVEWMTFPDGEKLPGLALWQYDTITGTAAPLATHPARYTGTHYFYRTPTYSPDGKHIAFIGEGLHGETSLFVRPTMGAKPEIEFGRSDTYSDAGWPAWSTDGSRLVFRQGILRRYTADPLETLRVIEPGGREAHRVFATTPERYDRLVSQQPLIAAVGSQGGPERSDPKIAGIAWWQDGKRLAFSVARDPNDPVTYSLWTLALDNSLANARAAPGIDPSNKDGYAAAVWMDSRTLGAIRISQGKDPGSRYSAVSIYLPPDPHRYSAVTTIAELPSADMDWSPDRTRIVAAGPPAEPRAGTTALLTTLHLIKTK